ncbi:neuropeptide S [Sorex fumeus]|uniref:neuropeptide S n=1 Tax=Sorex fumeus TaxID=62283 RepID=UPI0024ADF227|nr:neuropeptide S [Sorex fumeus]
MMRSPKFHLLLILSLSMASVLRGSPVPPPKGAGKSDCFLLLSSFCPPRPAPGDTLDFLKPALEKMLMKRSFRNGVGMGMKKTSFQRAKS